MSDHHRGRYCHSRLIPCLQIDHIDLRIKESFGWRHEENLVVDRADRGVVSVFHFDELRIEQSDLQRTRGELTDISLSARSRRELQRVIDGHLSGGLTGVTQR